MRRLSDSFKCRRPEACLRQLRGRAGAAPSGEAAQQGRSAADRSENRQAAGAAEPVPLNHLQFRRCMVGTLPPDTVEQSAAPGPDRSPRDARGLSLTFHLIDPQMSPHIRVLSFSELKRASSTSVGTKRYIAQLVGASLFPAPI